MPDANRIVDELVRVVFERVTERLADVTPVPKRILTLDEAAEYLGCSPRYVRQLVAEGKVGQLAWSDKPAARPYFDVRDLDAAIEQAKRKGSAA